MDAKTALAKIGSSSKRKQKGLPKRAGKRGPKYTRYYARYNEKKIRRILKHNGYQAAKAWADAHSCLSTLTRLTN